MEIIILLIINVLIYILSIIKAYKYIKLSFSSIGFWENNDLTLFKILIIITPIINTVVWLLLLDNLSFKSKKKKRRKKFLSN